MIKKRRATLGNRNSDLLIPSRYIELITEALMEGTGV
jgi:hypothetical protein